MSIGEYIKALREQRHWTLRELGEAAGQLSIGFISDIERGRSDPSLTTLHRLAKAFGMGAGDLLVGAGYSKYRPQFAVGDRVQTSRRGDGTVKAVLAPECAPVWHYAVEFAGELHPLVNEEWLLPAADGAIL